MESQVEKTPAVAGWRGLKDPEVEHAFNMTWYGLTPDWGPNEALFKNLGLGYRIIWGGDEAAATTLYKSMLNGGQSVVFYLWSPHAMLAQYRLSRIQLPEYSSHGFHEGKTDYPPDVLDKVASKTLAKLAPQVYQLYSRFNVEATDQQEIMSTVATSNLTMMQAVCKWLESPINKGKLRSWIPEEQFTCKAGQYTSSDNHFHQKRCEPCRAGSYSSSGVTTECTICSAGPVAPSLAHGLHTGRCRSAQIDRVRSIACGNQAS